MTLQKREKVLAAVVGALLLVVAGRMGFRILYSPLSMRQAEVEALQQRIAERQSKVEAAMAAQARLAEYRKRSLPSDPQAARSLYQNWLLELTDRLKLKGRKVESSDGRVVKGIYHNLPFTVRGEGGLDQLVQFLYEFYSAGHLHRIRRLSIKPQEKSSDLELTIVIEALALADADRRDKLTALPGNRLAHSDLNAYRKSIVERNLFASYRPAAITQRQPPRETPKPPEPIDPSKFAYVTAIVQVDGQPQVWVKARTKDENYRLHEGQRLEIGSFKGVISRIADRHVEIAVDGKSDGKPLVVALGEPLRKTE